MGFYASLLWGGLGKTLLDWLERTLCLLLGEEKKKELFLKIDEFALNTFSSGCEANGRGRRLTKSIYMPLGIKRLAD